MGLAGLLAALTLLRPSDATLFGAAIGLGLLWGLRRRGRRMLLGAVLTVGGAVAVGWLQWVVEAYTSYGGFFTRLSDASEHNGGGPGWHVVAQLRVVHGPIACKNCAETTAISVLDAGLWFGLLALTAIGLYVGYRARRLQLGLFVVLCAFATVFTYFFLIPISAPRFMLPAYALLALPAADGLVGLPSLVRARWRRPVIGLLAAGVVGYLVVQQVNLVRDVNASEGRVIYQITADRLTELGVEPPCLVVGDRASEVAYIAGCGAAEAWPPERTTTPDYLEEAARTMDVAVLDRNLDPPDAYMRDWPVERVASDRTSWLIYLPPPELAAD